MNKVKKLRVKLSASIVATIVLCLAIAGVAGAFSGVIQNIENFYEAQPQETSLGAMASPDIPYNWLKVGGLLE